MYSGDNIDAAPIATPPPKRAQANCASEVGMADSREEMANSSAQKTRLGLRPKRSPIGPPAIAPAMQPIRRLDAAQPVSSAESWKCTFKKPMAPETTAVS